MKQKEAKVKIKNLSSLNLIPKSIIKEINNKMPNQTAAHQARKS